MTKQATSKTCYVCGRDNPFGLKMDFFLDENGVVTSSFKLHPNYEGFPGVVHGGVISAILDEIAGRAIMGHTNQFNMTASLTVRFRKPVPVNTELLAMGFFQEKDGRVNKATSQILDDAGEILAEAEGVFIDMPERYLSKMGDYLNDWKVYPTDGGEA